MVKKKQDFNNRNLRWMIGILFIIFLSFNVFGASGTFTICPSGCDYSSLYSWEAGEQANLTGTGPCIANITEGFVDTQLSIAGWITTSDDYIKIVTTPEARHDGKWDATAYTIISGTGSAINVGAHNVHIEGLQIDDSNDLGGGIFTNGPYAQEGLTISNNIIRCTGTCHDSLQHGINLAGIAGTALIRNNIIYGFNNTGGSYGMKLNQLYPRGGVTPYVYSNTVYGCYNGIQTDDDAYYSNNIAYDNLNTDYTGQIPLSGSGNNFAKDSTAPGINSISGDAEGKTPDFVSTVSGSEDFHIQLTSDAINSGLDLSSYFLDDIDGEIRPQGIAWDIGADEGIASPDTIPPLCSSPSPTTNLSSGTTQTYINLTTDETANCRYSTTSGVSYPSMADTFTNTDSTTHSELISGLIDGNTYNFYVRCNDTFGNYNTNDFLISFGVSESSGSCSPADTDTDGVVDIIELMDYISQWKSGSVTITELMTGIGEWKNGCI